MKQSIGFLLAVLVLSLGACTQKKTVTDYPRAEWDPARVILMHTPGQELFNGVIHPSAGLFEDYFDVDKAAEEHRAYIRMLEKNGIQVYTVSEILDEVGIDSLRILAGKVLLYDIGDFEEEGDDAHERNAELKQTAEDYRRDVLYKMSRADNWNNDALVWMSDRFTQNVVEFLSENPKTNYHDLFLYCARHTLGSHARILNAGHFGNLYGDTLSEFIQYN